MQKSWFFTRIHNGRFADEQNSRPLHRGLTLVLVPEMGGGGRGGSQINEMSN